MKREAIRSRLFGVCALPTAESGVLLLLGAFFWLCGGAALQAGQKPLGPLLPPRTPAGAQGVFVASPDGLYEARITGGDAVPTYVSLYRVSGGHRKMVLPRVVDAQEFLWVPKHPHMLVVAAGGATGDFQGAQVGLWNGGGRLRGLVPVKDRGTEGFDLEGVTADGTVLVYDHQTAEGKMLVNLRLRLPFR